MALAFPTLGKHCCLKGCGVLDFLPFECALCHQNFCLEHRTEAGHSCSGRRKEPLSTVCPLCNRVLAVGVNELSSDVVTAHIESGCPPLSSGNVYTCAMRKCKNREIVSFMCKSCQRNFCISHRLSMDHKCEGAAVAQRHPSSSSSSSCRQEFARASSALTSSSASSFSGSARSSSRTNVGVSRLLSSFTSSFPRSGASPPSARPPSSQGPVLIACR